MKNEASELFKEEFIEQIEDVLLSKVDDLKDTLEIFKLELDEINKKNTSNDIQYSQIIEDTLSDTFRKSHFITIFSILEQSMVTICKHTKRLLNKKLSLNDLRGKGCEQCKNYLVKVIEIEIPNEKWSKIKLYRDIRNYIVHSESVIFESNDENYDTKNAKLLERVQGMESINVTEQNNLQLTHKFLENLLSDIYEFLHNIFIELKRVTCRKNNTM